MKNKMKKRNKEIKMCNHNLFIPRVAHTVIDALHDESRGGSDEMGLTTVDESPCGNPRPQGKVIAKGG